MSTSDAVAIYAASLSTGLALAQGIAAWRTRVRVSVEVAFSSGPVSEPLQSSYGTPLLVRRGQDTATAAFFLEFTVRNLGGKAVQIAGVIIESPSSDGMNLHASEFTPKPLPVVLESLTSISVTLQKEHLDMLESLTFLGIVDGTGRRHPVARRMTQQLADRCWEMPTQVAIYRRRDDPSVQVLAFQLQDPGKLTTRPQRKRRWARAAAPIASRPRPVMETIANGEQPKALS